MTDIHSCSYYCDRPECIKTQRDELRDKLAQRTWVGLTEEEAEDIWRSCAMHTPAKLAKAIEAKLKEKNND
jgi:hypothetical protein